MSLLDRFDPVFIECLACLCPPPYPTAVCVEQTISEAIIKAKKTSDWLYKMNFKESIANDLDNILALNEVSDDVVLGTGENAISGKAVIDINGQSESDWSGGSSIAATALLPKSVFVAAPKVHDVLTVSNGRTYYVCQLVNESSAAWTVSLVSELKARG